MTQSFYILDENGIIVDIVSKEGDNSNHECCGDDLIHG